ncbi:MAG: hypothetical protein IOD12_16165 [Silvanigrellales bacterium]|nr:hypothetical protein [Silvanigrellales bacterium]
MHKSSLSQFSKFSQFWKWNQRSSSTLAWLTLGIAMASASGCRNDEEPSSEIPEPAGEKTNLPKAPQNAPTQKEPQGRTKAPDPETSSPSHPEDVSLSKEKSDADALAELLASRTNARALPNGALVDTNGRIVLDESSLGAGERTECLDTLVKRAFATPERAKPWRDAGVDAVFAADGSVRIVLSKPAVLAISTPACDAPSVRVETQGHALTLAGSDFKNVVVDTRKANGNAGDVVLLGTGSNTPVVLAEGAPGMRGNDASCPSGFEGCTNDAAPAFARPSVSPVFQAKSSAAEKPATEKSANGKTYESLLKPAPFSRAEPIVQSDCGSGFAKFVSGPAVSHTGRVRLTTNISTPFWPAGANLDGRDGLAVSAKNGSPGFSGGRLDAFGLADAAFDTEQWNTKGGLGGAPGKGGLVAAAPGVASVNVSETTKIDVEAHTAKVIGTFEWIVTTFPFTGEIPGCRGSVGRVSTRTVQEVAKFQASRAPVLSSTRAVTLPGGRAGFTPARPVANAGSPGADGAVKTAKSASVEDTLKRVPAEVVLPKKMATDLTRAWNEGTLAFAGAKRE